MTIQHKLLLPVLLMGFTALADERLAEAAREQVGITLDYDPSYVAIP